MRYSERGTRMQPSRTNTSIDQYMKLQTTPTKVQRLVIKKKKPATFISLDDTIQNTVIQNSSEKSSQKQILKS